MREKSPIKGARKWILFLYSGWERLYYRIHKIEADHAEDILYIRPMTYKGPPIPLDDGTVIQAGDRVLQLHFNNKMLIEASFHAKNTMQMITSLLRVLKSTLKRLGEKLESDTYKDIKGMYGVSLMHRGATQFGFSVIELPDGFSKRYQHFYLRMLMAIMHPNGKERLKQKTDLLTPKIVAASRDTFLQHVRQDKTS